MKHVVIGASGGIGAALADEFEARGHRVQRISRQGNPWIDLLSEKSIEMAAAQVHPDLEMVIDATGFLHGDGYLPEKSLSQLTANGLEKNFAVNTIGPALIMKHFLPKLSRSQRAVFATLSARVGSISENELGGWYGYRASKAALNQLVRTAAIEMKRKNKFAICVALHPGTVDTALSAPFRRSGLEVQSVQNCAGLLVGVLEQLSSDDSGFLIDHCGIRIPF